MIRASTTPEVRRRRSRSTQRPIQTVERGRELPHRRLVEDVDFERVKSFSHESGTRNVAPQITSDDDLELVRKRMSFSKRLRRSSNSWRMNANRSMPNPNAKPVQRSGSTPVASKTAGWTIPQPPSSIQPVYEHVRQPAPRQIVQVISNSADGSVKGKYAAEGAWRHHTEDGLYEVSIVPQDPRTSRLRRRPCPRSGGRSEGGGRLGCRAGRRGRARSRR